MIKVRPSITWQLFDFASVYWNKLDNFGSKHHHLTLDRFTGTIRGTNWALEKAKYYWKGWGNTELPSQFYPWLRLYAEERNAVEEVIGKRLNKEGIVCNLKDIGKIKRQIARYPRTIKETSFLQTFDKRNQIWVTDVTFETTAKEIKENLPEESRISAIRIVSPFENIKGSKAVILLAGTGEHRYDRRFTTTALPLAKKGIVSVMLESPYYGMR